MPCCLRSRQSQFGSTIDGPCSGWVAGQKARFAVPPECPMSNVMISDAPALGGQARKRACLRLGLPIPSPAM